MKYKAAILILILFIAKSWGYTLGTCEIEDSDGLVNWEIGIYRARDIKDYETIQEWMKVGGTGTLSVTETMVDYLTAEVVNQTLILKTTDDFKNFELEMRSEEPNSAIQISGVVQLNCDDEVLVLSLTASVEDTNNHLPTFESEIYKYTMPIPLPPKIDLTNFGVPIIAEDLDFSNTNIQFTVDNDNFFVETLPGDDNRLFKTALQVANYFTLTETTELTLTAIDTGSPPASSATKITIEIDGDFSLPNIPTFFDALYKFDYSEDSGSPTVTPSDGKEIQVITSDSTKTAVSLDEEGQLYFTSEYDPTTNKVFFESNGVPIPPSFDSFLVLQLAVTFNANPEESSNTVILVELPSDCIIPIPQFNDPYYIATYSKDSEYHTVILDKPISVTEKAEVTVEGDYNENFGIDCVDLSCSLTVLNNLDSHVLEKESEILLIIEASVEGSMEKDTATVIISLPLKDIIKAPEFTQPIYTASYNKGDDGTVTLTVDPKIQINSNAEITDVSVTLDGDYKNYFGIKLEDSYWSVIIIKDLPQSVIEDKVSISLNLVATKKDVRVTGNAGLVVNLPQKKMINTFHFKNDIHISQYVSNSGECTISLDEEISGNI